jgi:hypothetical protein
MEIKKYEDLNEGDRIKADLYSRPNAMNGKYRAGQIGLDNLSHIKDSDVFLLETLKVRADSADKMIAEAESQGKDTTDPDVMRELGEKINALGKPIHRSEAITTAVFVSLQLIAYCGIAIGIWGLVFKKSFLVFSLYGAVAGFVISLLFVAPVIAFQRTKERKKNIVYGADVLLTPIIFIIGIVGLIAWVIKLIFF